MTLLISPDALLARRATIAGSPQLVALDAHLAADIGRVLAQPLYVPESKAQLSRWGAYCHDDEAELAFDPFQPHQQRCSQCGRIWNTELSHRWWVYWYQLWLAERVLMMALRSGPGGDAAAETRAVETLAMIVARYPHWPNADNVLGPTRPFFSTYLESVWVLHLAAAASTLEGQGRLPRDLAADLRARLFAPSAAIIADFDEGRSNRQVWNAAALYGLGRVLDDGVMQERAANGPSGILASLTNGVLADGLWYEGENYHWFTLRGITWGAEMLRQAGARNLWADDGEAGVRFRAAFRAPVLTGLPDFTFPARRDSKFGVSMRQRRMAELWELALSRSSAGTAHDVVGHEAWYASLLTHVYDPSVPETDDSWREITDVERVEAPRGVRREHLGWKAWLWMVPELPAAPADAWRPATTHLETTGLAIFRRDQGRSYVSLDYGESGGGHGHPERLNLTAVLNGVSWLLDFGTGSYVAPSLAWYRTTLAHNAPLVDSVSQAPANGQCIAFDERDGHGWVCACLPSDTAFDAAMLQRTVVVTPTYLLDVVQMRSDTGERQLALPWHGLGAVQVDENGLRFTRGEGQLRVHLSARQPFQVVVRKGPGPPQRGGAEQLEFPIAFASGEDVTLAACLDTTGAVESLECNGDAFEVHLADGTIDVHRATDDGWLIEPAQGRPVELAGLRELPEPGDTGPASEPEPSFTHPIGAPLELGRADQFRRAEEPWSDNGRFTARARLAVKDEALHVAVEVTGGPANFRADAPDPEWENENPDIHSDGVQVYVEDGGFFGWLLVPDAQDESKVRVAPVRGTDGEKEMIDGATWSPTATGYTLAFDILLPEPPSREFGFDLYVNRLAEGRQRRSGQLVWSGARGARLYLAGDRALPGPLPRVKL